MSSPSRNQPNTVYPKPPPWITLLFIWFAQGSRQTETLLSGLTFQGCRDYLQKQRASARSLFEHPGNYNDDWLFTLNSKFMCVSPTMEVRSLRSETKQHAMSSSWMNKRVNESPCFRCKYNILTSSALVWERWFYLIYSRNMSLSTSLFPTMSKSFYFYQWASLWKNTHLKHPYSVLGDNGIQNLLDFSRHSSLKWGLIA